MNKKKHSISGMMMSSLQFKIKTEVNKTMRGTLTHGKKIYERIIEKRLRTQVEEKIANPQHDFISGGNTVLTCYLP